MSAVRLGEKSITMTNAASAMPAATAKPAWVSTWFSARVSDANGPARMRPAEAMAGPACATA